MNATDLDTRIWEQNAVGLIQSGLFRRVVVRHKDGLSTVHGEYQDDSLSAALAKYHDSRRADDAASLINHKAGVTES